MAAPWTDHGTEVRKGQVSEEGSRDSVCFCLGRLEGLRCEEVRVEGWKKPEG